MIPNADVQPIPGFAAPESGSDIGASLEVFIPPFSSSEALNGSISVSAKSTHAAGGSAPGAPLAFVLSKVFSTLGLTFVLEISSCGVSRAYVLSATPGESAAETV